MIRRTKEQWLELFQQHHDSGLSAAHFCRQHSLCDKYFALRKKQLLSDEKKFIPVVSATKKITREVPLSSCALLLRTEHCALQFECLPDAQWLSQLIRSLS